MATLQLENIKKSYENKEPILSDLNLQVEDGEFLVLVGPSGCGKSTLLRLLAGLEDITSGSIYIGGNKVNELPPAKRNIAMVFQDYALYPHMTVEENLSFGLRIAKVAEHKIKERVTWVSQMLSIDHLLNRRPAQLSGGQRQRVAIGRAIVRQPAIFLFDEPLSNLDAQLRAQTRIELAAMHQKLKTTTVYVTHDQVEAMTLATRIVVLNKGKVQQCGSPLELYNTPSNKFTAGFIGNPSMNFFSGVLEKNGQDAVFRFRNSEIDFSSTPHLVPKNPGPYTLGLRPEAIKVLTTSGRESSGPEDLILEVQLLEPHGHEVHLVCTIDNMQAIVRSANPARLSVMNSAKHGDYLKATVDRTALHWFFCEGDEIRAM